MAEDANRRAELLLDRALDEMAAGRPEVAVDILRQAAAAAPEDLTARHALVRALEDSGRLEEAVIAAREMIEGDPDDPLVHTRLSILLQRMGDVPGAEAASAKARILEWKRQLRG